MLLQKMFYLLISKAKLILLLNLPFFSLVVSKMEVGPTKPTAENDLILNFKGQNESAIFFIGGQQNGTWTKKIWIVNKQPQKNFEMIISIH